MHIEPPTLRDRLSHEPITSPPRKKSKTSFGSLVNDLKEDDEWTCSDEIGGGGGKELDAIAMQGRIEKKLEPNLDQVIHNIQIELVVFVEPIITITEHVVAATKSFQHVQPIVEPI